MFYIYFTVHLIVIYLWIEMFYNIVFKVNTVLIWYTYIL